MNLRPCCAVCSNPVSLGAGVCLTCGSALGTGVCPTCGHATEVGMCVVCGSATEIVLLPRDTAPTS